MGASSEIGAGRASLFFRRDGAEIFPDAPAVHFVWANSMNTRGPRGVASANCFSYGVCGTASPSEFLSCAGLPFTSSM